MIAGVGARIVGLLLDLLVALLIPVVLAAYVVDWGPILDQLVEAARLDPTGRVAGSTIRLPITPAYIIAILIGLGIQYLYFVGFWTTRWRATPGMMALRMRVVDAETGGQLSVLQATKRWIAFGWPLSLLGLIPLLQSVGILIQVGVAIFVFFTTVTNDRRQGLHDKWANSIVIRSVTSGDGATFAGCLVWGVLLIVIGFLVLSFLAAANYQDLQDFVNEFPTPAP